MFLKSFFFVRCLLYKNLSSLNIQMTYKCSCRYLSSKIFQKLLYIFDEVAYGYILSKREINKMIDLYFPQKHLQVKHIILHHPDGQQTDLTTQLDHSNPNLSQLEHPGSQSGSRPKSQSGSQSGYQSGSHLGYQPGYHLEIYYQQGAHKYRIIYDSQTTIQFPPYHSQEIDEHLTSEEYQNNVLFATYLDQDVTEILKQLAGPKGNFYQDKGINMNFDKVKKIIHLHLGQTPSEPANLLITDNYANDYTFQENHEKIVLCKKNF